MALQKREKNLIIGLVVVAILGGYKLWKNKQPDPEVVKQEEAAKKKAEEKKKEDAKKEKAASSSSGSSRSSRGSGASRSSSGSSGAASKSVSKVSYGEFSSHSDISSCWVLIKGEVYNITAYVTLPDSASLKLAQYCGTTAFEDGYIQGSYEKQEEVKTYSTLVGSL